jgi:hypothetical protein
MSLWHTLVAGLLACVPVLFFLFKWFLLETDVTVSYNWSQSRLGSCPNFNIRNRSRSRTYLLGNVVYKSSASVTPVAIDNKSLWEQELKPGSTKFFQNVAVVADITTMQQCLQTMVYVRLQNGREIKGQGPGQLLGRFRRVAFWLRRKLDVLAVPVE